MMRRYHLVLVLALIGADSAPRGGTIEGRAVAVVQGTEVARDDVYVYLEVLDQRASRARKPGAGKSYEIRQVKEQFIPRVLVVPVGAVVRFPNLDKQVHNVFSPTDPAFDLGRYNFDKRGKSHVFEDADEFDIFCDMHRKMWAKVKAVDSPYIARVVNGKFSFANIPAGRYKVAAWLRNSKEDVKSRVVTVTDGGTITLDRALHVQVTNRTGCHPRKDGTQYADKYAACPDDY